MPSYHGGAPTAAWYVSVAMRPLALLGVAFAAGLVACDGARAREPMRPEAAPARAVLVRAVIDLPRGEGTQALSGVVWEPAARRLVAIQDVRPALVPLVPNADFTAWQAMPPLPLTGRPDEPWDGEGLAPAAGGYFVIAYERGPVVERFDDGGRFLGRVPLPSCYGHLTRPNLGLEGLAASPSGRSLFLANEAALSTDGGLASGARGTVVRITKRDLASGAEVELAYRTEPLGRGGDRGDMGVADVAATSDDDLLVLERGYQKGYGNTIRVFRTHLRDATPVAAGASIDDRVRVLPKHLVVDVGSLACLGCAHPGTQPNPILENYEGLALGPEVEDGRRLLFLVSDDNESATQVPRLLVLAVPLEALR